MIAVNMLQSFFNLLKRHHFTMRKSSLIIKHLIFWLSIPFLISFFIWAYQFTVFLPNLENQMLGYPDIVVKNSVISLTTVAVGAFGFYITYFLVAPKILRKDKRVRIFFFSTDFTLYTSLDYLST